MKCKHEFVVKRSIWPYPDGFGTQCKKCKMIMDSGLTKEQAEECAKELNSEHVQNR